MSVEDVTYRFEVQLGTRWVPCTAAALDVDESDIDSDVAGEHELIGLWTSDPGEIAAEELNRAISKVVVGDVGLADMTGLRVLLWHDRGAQGDPQVVITATDEQLVIGKLRRAAEGVSLALAQEREARRRLRKQVLAASREGLGRNHIARELDGTWSRRLVLQYLTGHDLAQQILMSLPAKWPRPPRDAWDEREFGLPESFPCGPVRLDLTTSGEVELTIASPDDDPDDNWGSTPPVDWDALADARRDREQKAAREVLASLIANGYQARTKDGRVVDTTELGRLPVLVSRSSQPLTDSVAASLPCDA